ncbi:MAG: enoyl-CoA hydratase-related protein [Anaeromyxobacter sp.]
MTLENILWKVEDGVGVATFNRPKVLNALDARTVDELSAVVAEVEAGAARALVLTGGGEKAFVAGADIAAMSTMTATEARAFAERMHRVLDRMEALAVPTLAAVNGFALGGGCEVALACDLVYAGERARFGQPEVNLGLVPGFGGSQRLARRVGSMAAMELVLTGDPIDAARARELGLVLAVLPPEQLLPHVLGQARKIASRGPVAVAQAKRLVRVGLDGPLSTGNELERQAFSAVFATEDAREGMRAFLEKRPAQFQGR